MQQESTPEINWKAVGAVIFDVDGTLYDQSKLRKKMLFTLLNYYCWRPWRLRELMMLAHFREEREKRAGQGCQNLEQAQYTWCVEKKGYNIQNLKATVEKWMFQQPLSYLGQCTYHGTQELFRVLRQKGIKIAIYSDYNAHDKLEAMGLKADLIVSSTDPEVNQLKPDPKGLLYAVEQLGLAPADCLFIGDRQEMDGECALRAKMPYLIIEKKPYHQFDFYQNLLDTIHAKTYKYGSQALTP